MSTREADTRLESIRESMSVIREQLSAEVGEAIQQAKDVVDWRTYVRDHPWLTFGITGAMGYLAIPSATKKVTVLQAGHSDVQSALKAQRSAERPTLTSLAISGLTAFAMRKAMSIAQASAEQWLNPPTPRAESQRATTNCESVTSRQN